MHAVLSLVEDDRLRAREHFVCDLHLGDAELVGNFLADRRVRVMERRQAVHEHGVRLCHGHLFRVHLILFQKPDALCPHAVGLAHRDPDVGIQNVCALRALFNGFRERHGAAALGRVLLRELNQLFRREQLLWRAGREVKAHLRAGDHEGVSHIVARVAEIGKFKPLERALLLFDGEKVGKHLRRVELVGQTVPHRNARILGQLLDDFLAEAAVLNAVIHPAQNLRGVRDGLLLSHLAAARVEIGHAHTKVPARDFERAACARRRFLKQQNNIFAL